jgi:cell division protein FtsL
MTPSALTPAARGSTKKSRPDAPSRPSSARGSGHRSNVRRSAAPTAPRRVSGPAGGVSTGGVIAVPAPARTRPTQPRTAPSRPRTRPAVAKAPWRLRTADYVRALPDHALLDRVVRGRVWIPLLGVLLAGIVAMQVEVLKLNAGIGRSLERGSALQAQNQLLRAGVARLSDEQRIERIAAQTGMQMPAPERLKFVKGRGAVSVERALGSIHAPNGTDFLASLPTIGAPVAAQGTSGSAGVALTASGAASSTSSTGATPPTGTAATTAGTAATTAGTAATSAGTTSAGTTSSGTTAPVTPTAPTPPAGTTGQSGSSSSTGGVGGTPVGG